MPHFPRWFHRLLPAILIAATLLAARPALAQAAADQPAPESTCRKVMRYARFTGLVYLSLTGHAPKTDFGIVWETGAAATPSAKPAAADRPWVLLVHGWNSSPERSANLLLPARAAGLHCGAFRYPNNQSLADSAGLLSRELRREAREHPGRPITIVAFSMGGLIAREAIENPALDPGNVRQLLLIATPSHGTVCAKYGHGLDVCEHFLVEKHASPADSLVACFENGLGEALCDLTPGSPFLKRLNARPRNPQVKYALFLGTGGKLSDTQMMCVHCVTALAPRTCGCRLVAAKVDKTVERLNRWLDDGDGVVPLASGRLEGVSDVTLLSFNHGSALLSAANADAKQLHAALLAHLRADSPQSK